MELHIYEYSYISILANLIELEQMTVTLKIEMDHHPESALSDSTSMRIRHAKTKAERMVYLKTSLAQNKLIQMIIFTG